MTEAVKSKPVTRVYDLGERRPVVATFKADGVVEFRLKGKRQRYEAHLRSLFRRAVELYADAEKRQKRIERAAKRAAREA